MGGRCRAANDNACRANNTCAVWRAAAASLPPTCLPLCHYPVMLARARPTGHFIMSKCSDSFQHARTQTHRQDCVHTYPEMRIVVSYQSLAAPADTAEAFDTEQNMISPGNTFSISLLLKGRPNKPRLSSSEYIWPIKTTPLSRVLLCCRVVKETASARRMLNGSGGGGRIVAAPARCR